MHDSGFSLSEAKWCMFCLETDEPGDDGKRLVGVTKQTLLALCDGESVAAHVEGGRRYYGYKLPLRKLFPGL